MKQAILSASLLAIITITYLPLSAADQLTVVLAGPVVRKPLLTARLEAGKTVDRVEIKEIEMLTPLEAGRHLHPCPVVGYIVEGQIVFQIEGQPEQRLLAGDAFFEPANTNVAHFDNVGPGKAKFVAYYLLSSDDHELIKMLPTK
jgi:quercetin dioxygenase-like cupin family protein